MSNLEQSPKQLSNFLEVRNKIIALLKTIFDPEIPTNIWDLGLVYGVDFEEGVAKIVMTLTSPNCPAIDTLPAKIEQTILNLEEVTEVDLKIVWEPAWNANLMSEEVRLELGI